MTGHRTQKTALRLDIQGLRAVAVLAVVGDHLVSWPAGGFVGVDIFFVLSGYLITSHLLRERQQSGTISLGGFVRRRIRRLAPASLITLAVTVVATYLLLGQARFDTVSQDALYALGLSANWHFAAVGTDYFASSGPVSPLQHFWSLSVEEQFYLAWPLILLLTGVVASRLARRRGARYDARLWILAVILTICAASLAWALIQTASSPTVAYFSTLSRGWELGAGAALAAVLSWRPIRLGPVVSSALTWAGTVGIVLAIFITPSSPGFPAPWGLLPVVSTVAVLLGGANAPALAVAHLANPVMRYIGDISYSLYLWHYPVIIVGGPLVTFLLGQGFAFRDAVLLAGGLVLAVLSFHFVEQPTRRSKWLTKPIGQSLRGSRTVAIISAGVTVAVVVTALTFTSFAPQTSDFTHAEDVATTSAVAASGSKTAVEVLGQQITASLAATSWPADLTPSVADASKENPPGNTSKCGSFNPPDAAGCTFGDPNAPKKALLVGDSIAQAYVPALAQIYGTGDWSLQIMSMYACPYIDRGIGNAPAQTATCTKRREAENAAIIAQKPDLVIISNTYVRGTDPQTGLSTTRTDWNTAFNSMLARVAANAKTFVILPPPPPDKDIQACYTPLSKPADCVSTVSENNWLNMANDQQQDARKAGGHFIDNRDWYCDGAGRCPAFVGNTLVKKDMAHPTQAYIEKITPVIRDALVSAGVLQAPSNADQHG